MGKKKVLLMGDESGVKCMRSVIFAKYITRDTRRLGATIDVEHSHVLFLGNLVLNVCGCGGQEAFMENYFTSQRDNVFRNVEVLIYVFDVESREVERDMHYYQSCLEAILQNSPDAKVFCLIHKMDLIPEDQRSVIFNKRESELKKRSLPLECTCFMTSIWDETLYKAWSSIIRVLLPNASQLDSCAAHLVGLLDANEVVLFERQTFLVVAHSVRRPHSDDQRFEKISNIVKQFRLSCSKLGTQMKYLEVRNTKFAAFIHSLTEHIVALIVTSNSETSLATIQSCIQKSVAGPQVLVQPAHPSTVRSKMNVHQGTNSAEQDSSMDERSVSYVSPVSDRELSCDMRVDNLTNCLTKELEEVEARMHEAKVLLLKATKHQHEEFKKELEKQQAGLLKCIEEQDSELKQMKRQIKLQDACIQKQFKELQQLREQKNEKLVAKFEEELQLANQKAKEVENAIQQETEEKICKLIEDFEQIKCDLEQRAEFAEQRAMKLETQWVVNRDEITMTKRTLGDGGWGTVKVARFRGIEVAAKMLHQEIQSDYYRELFIREMNMAARLRHPNLVQFIGATIEGDMIILTELLPTNLRATLEKGAISQQEIIAIGSDICKALNYLHLMRPEPLVHRDVSSANILLEPLPNRAWKAKLTDYGTVNTLYQLKTQGPGNPTYSAPEASSPDKQSPKMDVFSFGILMIEMCSGKFPDVDGRDRLIVSIKDRPFVKLIRKCIVFNREKRPGIDEILTDLSSF